MLDLMRVAGADGDPHEELVLATNWVERFDPSRLREARLKRGLTQRQLGQRVDQDSTTIGKYENGRRVPRASTLFALVRALNVDVTDLLHPGPDDLAVLRFRRGLSQTEVAKALGVTQAWYHHIEAGRAKVDHSVVTRLAAILDVDKGTVQRVVALRDR